MIDQIIFVFRKFAFIILLLHGGHEQSHDFVQDTIMYNNSVIINLGAPYLCAQGFHCE